ncbi:MAG: FHA domain-containing protein [Kofleriaceae bacterium]
MRCAVCRATTAELGLLCEDCSDDLASPLHIAPEQIVSHGMPHGGAALLDRWGRPHRVEAPSRLGRHPGDRGISVLEVSISRNHAELTRGDSGWLLTDLGSANGTSLNDVRVVAPTSVRHGDKLAVSQVGFYFVEALDPGFAARLDPLLADTDRPGAPLRREQLAPPADHGFGDDRRTTVGLAAIEVRLHEPTGGGGGLFEVDRVSVQLSATQFELVALLVHRMAAEAHQPDDVRGFVRTSELIGQLSWDTRDPTENHVKQLVRRVRRAMVKAEVGDLIEARHRFGYRLRAVPHLVP